MHKALVIGISLLDISHMPFANVAGIVAGIAQQFGNGDFVCMEAVSGQRGFSFRGSGAGRVAPGHHGDASWSAGRLSVHTLQTHALVRQLTHARCSVAANNTELIHSDFAEANIVKQDINYVRGLSVVFISKLFQLLVDRHIVFRPLLTVLCGKNIILCIVNDFLV